MLRGASTVSFAWLSGASKLVVEIWGREATSLGFKV